MRRISDERSQNRVRHALAGAQNADRSSEMRRKTLTVRQKMRGWLGWRMLSGAQNADRSAEILRKTLTVRQKMRGWLG